MNNLRNLSSTRAEQLELGMGLGYGMRISRQLCHDAGQCWRPWDGKMIMESPEGTEEPHPQDRV